MDVKALEESLEAAEAALAQERHRAHLLSSELQRLRQSISSSPNTITNTINSALDSSLPPPPTATAATDMVLIPRATLDMLRLKERAMDAVKEGITIADAQAPDMPLVYVNEGFARITGYPTATFSMGKNCRFLQGPGTEPEVVQQLSDSIKAGQPTVVQITNYKRNGNPFINYLSLTPVHDASGVLTHYVGIQSDVTELVVRRKAELAARHAAVEAAAATEAKSQFLARMSHEIRTPLNGMIAVGQLLADTKLTPAQWDLVNTIRCSGEALLTLITDILDFSKIEANKMVLSSAPYALESTIEAAMEIAGLHAAGKRLQVAYHVAPLVPSWIVGDAQRLQQVLLNTLNNALKFTDSGEVLLEVWCSGGGGVGVGGQMGEEKQEVENEQEVEIHFSVRDTGIGISAPDLVRLFQSFSQVDASPTRRFGGSGLGLAISQKLSEAMGGHMWAESAGLGRGSTFRWCIKAKRAKAGHRRAAAFGGGSGGGGKGGGEWSSISRMLAADAVANKEKKDKEENEKKETNSVSEQLQQYVDSIIIPGLVTKRVLLVEPCDMVRQVLLLALRSWGCAVCAVGSERAAVTKLSLRPGIETPPPPAPAHPSSITATTKSRLSLAHATGGEALRDALAASAACTGPFDVVILDVDHTAVLAALMESCEVYEARRVVFLGWPGQNNPDSSTSTSTTNASGPLPEDGPPPAHAVAPPRMLTDPTTAPFVVTTATTTTIARNEEETSPSPLLAGDKEEGNEPPPSLRRVGYVVVSRPVRQGRLLIGLQEVLDMSIDADDDDSALARMNSTNSSATDVLDASKKSRITVQDASPPPPPPSSFPSSSRTYGRQHTDTHANAAHPSQYQHHKQQTAAAVVSDVAALMRGLHVDTRSEPTSDATSTTTISIRRSMGSTSSLLQAAPVKRVSSGSSLATADGFAGASHRLDNSTRRLLLAEDNAINMKVALGILNRLGFTNVVTAVDGVAAVEAVAAAGGPAAFDAILMDLHMPRKGGIEAVQDILRAWPTQRTKIIAVTADAFEDTRDTCVANGFTGWLAKPFRVEEFARIMGQQQQSPGSSPSYRGIR